MIPFRTGIGYDVHPLVAGRKLILGGITIPSEKGAEGHSDADVLIHAIADALLGSLALGDIGNHFPPNNPDYKDIDSSVILSRVQSMVSEVGYEIGNLDAVVVLQHPHIASFVDKMRERLAQVLKIEINQVSVKATTTENLGFAGRGEGVAAYATVLVMKKQV